MLLSCLKMLCIFGIGGCAGQQTAALERQIRELQDQNFELRRTQLEGGAVSSDAEPHSVAVPAPARLHPAVPAAEPQPSSIDEDAPAAAPPVEPAPAPASVAVPVQPPAVPAPARRAPVPVVVSPAVAPMIAGPGYGGGAMAAQCEDGPFALMLVNQTSYFLRVHVAPTPGRPVRPGENLGRMIQIPPHGRFNTCLTALGEHQIRGIAYTPVGPEMRRVNAFTTTRTFSTRSMSATGRQVLRIDQYTINFH